MVQNDAIERKGLKQLLLEPELLEGLEPDMNLAATLLMLKDQIPKNQRSRPGALSERLWSRSTGCWRRTCAGR